MSNSLSVCGSASLLFCADDVAARDEGLACLIDEYASASQAFAEHADCEAMPSAGERSACRFNVAGLRETRVDLGNALSGTLAKQGLLQRRMDEHNALLLVVSAHSLCETLQPACPESLLALLAQATVSASERLNKTEADLSAFNTSHCQQADHPSIDNLASASETR